MKNKKLKVLFRCDSSAKIGLGHLMRSLTLAKRLKELHPKLSITFASQKLEGNFNNKVFNEGFKLYTLHSNKASELINFITEKKFNLLVIDSYKIDLQFEKKVLNQTNAKILVFDDMFVKHASHMVLNHGFQVKKNLYKDLLPATTKLFCGAKYTILRDEFFETYPEVEQNKNIAIILGGNDIKNLSLKTAKLIKKIDPNYNVSVITTSVNPHLATFKATKEIQLFVDLKNIAKVLAKQTLVICASGGNLFEVMALQKKFINLQIADNQQSIVDFLNNKKLFTSLNYTELNKKNLANKIEYVMMKPIFKQLDLKFHKYYLAKKILKELQ